MNLRNLLTSFAVVSALPLFAATYYVTPEGAGTKDGSSWENAFGVEEFRAQAANNTDGDIYNLAGGIYKPSATVAFKDKTFATLNGNTNGQRTVFSGDKNNDNNPDNGDANRLIRFVTATVNGDHSKPVVINNIDFTCVYTQAASASDTMGGLFIDNSGDVTVNRCNFYGNWAQGDYGGAPAHLHRSTVKFTDCEFRNNSSNYRGAAIRLRSDKKEKGYTTFVNCVFKNNTNYHNLGGAVFMSHGAEMTFINCMITDNKATSGAAIYANSGNDYPCKINIINTTIAGNQITGDGEDGQVASTQYANINVVNSIIVSNHDNTADIFLNSGDKQAKFSFVSGGYNYVGSVVDNETPVVAPAAESDADAKIKWLESDNVAETNTYASIFGTNKIKEDNTIDPVKYVAGASGEQVTVAVASWNLPSGTDVTKDANGKTRTEGMIPGATGYTKTDVDIITGVEDIFDNSASILTTDGTGVYTIAGAEEVTAYSINGMIVASATGDNIDLSELPAGIYILRAGKNVFKVMK